MLADRQGEPLPASGPLRPDVPTHDQAERLAALLATMEGSRRVVVLTHDNPDPDAIAAAAGLVFLVQEVLDIPAAGAFGGIVGRAENRVLIQELGVKFERPDALGAEPAGTVVVLVDTQPRAGNNSLPAGRIASAVIDHHPQRPETAASPFADIRPDYGASSSMVVEYLRAAGLEPERRLATALFYAVHSETMDLGREASPADVSASLYLYPRSDPGAISRIRHAPVPESYFRAMHSAIREARRYGRVIVVPMGRLEYPDMVAEVADRFMHLEGTEWTVVLGRYGDALLLSLRTYDPRAHAGQLVRDVIGERGSAGGHGMLAGGQINLRHLSETEAQEVRDQVIEDLLDALGIVKQPPQPLIAETSLDGPPAGPPQ
ncbi:MAG: bifunctional oligoribonuclease/PAP phosphatase NrnA [Gemmatimonadota bacterium]